MANSILETISSEFASAAEKVGSSVVAVQARRWMPTSGIEWKKGVVVTVHHGVQRDEDIKVLLGDWSRSFRETGGTRSQYRHSCPKDRGRIFGRAPNSATRQA